MTVKMISYHLTTIQRFRSSRKENIKCKEDIDQEEESVHFVPIKRKSLTIKMLIH